MLVFQVFDSGVPDPEACVIGPALAFSLAIAKGFNKVAIQSNQVYGGYGQDPRVRLHQLQGTDKVFADHARANGAKKIEICNVDVDVESRIFRPQILFLRISTDFPIDPPEESDEDDDDCQQQQQQHEDEQEQQQQQQQKQQPQKRQQQTSRSSAGPRQTKRSRMEKEQQQQPQPPLLLQRSKVVDDFDFTPRFDEKGEQAVVKDEYRLGDTLFLATHDVQTRTGDLHQMFDYERLCLLCSLAIIAHF